MMADEPLKSKCLKCQRMVLLKDVPKRCSASISKRQESHVIELGPEPGEWPWQAPYGVSVEAWDRIEKEMLEAVL